MKPINERLERVEIDELVTIPAGYGSESERTITVRISALKDPNDGEIYLDADAIAAIDKARARHIGVLSPQQLTRLRKRLGLTQAEIASLLQIGEKTWSRWENGREIPSRSLNLLLLALHEGKIDFAYLRSKLAARPPMIPEFTRQTAEWGRLVSTGAATTVVFAGNVWSRTCGQPGDDSETTQMLLALVSNSTLKQQPPSCPSQTLASGGSYETMPMCA